MSNGIIYLDHAAATPLDERVLAAMQPYFTGEFYNPSSPYQQARDVRRVYEGAKDAIARVIGVKGDELIMTAGATESVNLAMSSLEGHRVVTTIEHPAVLRAAEQYDHTKVSVDAHGRVAPADIQAALRDDTVLVSVGLANSELGTIQPLSEIAHILSEVRQTRLESGNHTPLYLHSDASQGLGQVDVNVARLGVDLLTLNAGKVYGPKQVGLLYASRSVRLAPQIVGGGQEQGLRSGTENVAGVVGFAKAVELTDARRKQEVARLATLRDRMQRTLLDTFDDAVISGSLKHRLASHLHISFPGIDAERLLFLLEMKGVLVATGSACAANKGTRSHVLEAIGLTPEVADGSLRITLGHLTNDTNIDLATQYIIQAVMAERERVQR